MEQFGPVPPGSAHRFHGLSGVLARSAYRNWRVASTANRFRKRDIATVAMSCSGGLESPIKWLFQTIPSYFTPGTTSLSRQNYHLCDKIRVVFKKINPLDKKFYRELTHHGSSLLTKPDGYTPSHAITSMCLISNTYYIFEMSHNFLLAAHLFYSVIIP
ncbi:MAG: hypothetical protein ABF535_01340 [Acetobacter sp.]